MKTSFYFANDQVRAVVANVSPKKVKIADYTVLALPEGTLVNGVITDKAVLLEHMAEWCRTAKISGKVTFVVDSSEISFKALDVPLMKDAQLQAAARREIESTGTHFENPVTGYTVLRDRNEDGKGGRILCCAMSREMLDSYKELAADLKLKLAAVDMALNCFIKVMKRYPSLLSGRFVLSYLDKQMMSCILFDEGNYLFSNRSLLQSPVGSDECAAEMAGKLSQIGQFYKSERRMGMIEQAYFCQVEAAALDSCKRVTELTGIKVDALPQCPFISTENVKKTVGRGQFFASDYLPAVGGLLGK